MWNSKRVNPTFKEFSREFKDELVLLFRDDSGYCNTIQGIFKPQLILGLITSGFQSSAYYKDKFKIVVRDLESSNFDISLKIYPNSILDKTGRWF